MIRNEVKVFKFYCVIEGNYRVWLDKNESFYDFFEELKEEIFEELKSVFFNCYFYIIFMLVREVIGEFYGFLVENVVVGKGGDEFIGYFVCFFEGDYIVIIFFIFGMYFFYVRLNGIFVIEVFLREDFMIDGDIIVEKVKKVLVVFIVLFNNLIGNF